MTKLQFLKICVLNLIFGTTIIAGDAGEVEEPKRLRATVVRIDSEFELPEGAICVAVPRKLYEEMLLDNESDDEDGDSELRLAKHFRDTYKMSDDELKQLEYLISAIPSMDETALRDSLRMAVDEGHLNITRHLRNHCSALSLKVALGDTTAGRKKDLRNLILSHTKMKKIKVVSPSDIFLSKNTPRTRVMKKGLLNAG